MTRLLRAFVAAALFVGALAGLAGALSARQARIYWGDEVPAGWNGKRPADSQTVPERTGFTRTMSTLQLHEWIAALKLGSENAHVVRMFTSPLGTVAPAIVLANPRVTAPEQARDSGKPVVFLMGNIHPPEPEAAEALLLVARDLAAGRRAHLLQVAGRDDRADRQRGRHRRVRHPERRIRE